MSQVAVAELAAVLSQLGLDVTDATSRGDGADLVLPGPVLLDVKSSARPGLGWLERQSSKPATAGALRVLVADQVDPGLRRALTLAGWGWLDRSGHLRLVRDSLQLDRQIPSLLGPDTAPIDPLARPTSLAVALRLLEGTPISSVRDVAAASGVSIGAAHKTLTELSTLGLIEGAAIRSPDLFWAVAARWSTRWYALATEPGPVVPEPVQRLLQFGIDAPHTRGWAEVGDRAAQRLGARVAGEGPPKYYLPDQRALTWAVRTWKTTEDARDATALLSVPRTTAATTDRIDVGNDFLAARPIVVALDLAADGSPRSREVLTDWTNPPDGQPHVW